MSPTKIDCPRCDGSGVYSGFGVCYRCNGAGKVNPVPARKASPAPNADETAEDKEKRLRKSFGDADYEAAQDYYSRKSN